MLLFLMPGGIERPARRPDRRLGAAFRPDLLRLDLYIFVLHALPFLLRNELDLALGDHWQIYIGALLMSLLGTVPLILADERQGKSSTLTLAILLLLAGQLILAFVSFNLTIVFVALAVFFAGFNFLEAGLPGSQSVLPATCVARRLACFRVRSFSGHLPAACSAVASSQRAIRLRFSPFAHSWRGRGWSYMVPPLAATNQALRPNFRLAFILGAGGNLLTYLNISDWVPVVTY
jgi:hypothetical protein